MSVLERLINEVEAAVKQRDEAETANEDLKEEVILILNFYFYLLSALF